MSCRRRRYEHFTMWETRNVKLFRSFPLLYLQLTTTMFEKNSTPVIIVSLKRRRFRSSSLLLLSYTLLLHETYERCWNKPVLANTFYEKCNISTSMLLTMLEEKGEWRCFKSFSDFSKIWYLIIAYWKKYSYRRNEEVIESLLLKSEMFFQSVRHVQFNSRIVSWIRISHFYDHKNAITSQFIEITCRRKKMKVNCWLWTFSSSLLNDDNISLWKNESEIQ